MDSRSPFLLGLVVPVRWMRQMPCRVVTLVTVIMTGCGVVP